MLPLNSKTESVCYELIIEGQLSAQWADWFDGLTLENLPDGRARICGLLPDQPALRGLLDRIFDLNLTLISLRQV